MNALEYVGAAYACIWGLIFVYVWRLSASAKSLGKKIEALERERG